MTARGEGDRFDGYAAELAEALGSTPPALEAVLQWAGREVRVRVAGHDLARIFLRAVAHLALPPEENQLEPAFSVSLLEADGSAVGQLIREIAPELPRTWSAPDLEIRSSTCGRIVRFAFGHRSVFLLDRKLRVVVGVQDPDRLVLFERTKPLLLPLRVCLQDLGVHVLHAGLVADRQRGVLIAGPERSGKSTTALSCFAAGFDLLGDDQTAFARSHVGFVGHSLYGAVQVQADWLPQLGTFPVEATDRGDGEDKIGLFLTEVAPDRLARSVPIRAIVLPRMQPGAVTHLAPASRAEALMRIAPSTLFQPLGAGSEGVRALSRLVDRTPAYWLDLGAHGSPVHELLRRVLPDTDDR